MRRFFCENIWVIYNIKTCFKSSKHSNTRLIKGHNTVVLFCSFTKPRLVIYQLGKYTKEGTESLRRFLHYLNIEEWALGVLWWFEFTCLGYSVVWWKMSLWLCPQKLVQVWGEKWKSCPLKFSVEPDRALPVQAKGVCSITVSVSHLVLALVISFFSRCSLWEAAANNLGFLEILSLIVMHNVSLLEIAHTVLCPCW